MKRSKLRELKKLKSRMKGCELCGNATTRDRMVFGRGACNKRIVILGEAPGPEEDMEGDPFIGKAGTILDKLLKIAGLERNNTFIMNTVLCYPGRNPNGGFNKPTEEEIIRCAPRLMKTLSIIQPKLIIVLGNSALFALKNVEGIRANRGWGKHREHSFESLIYVSYHPSAIGRNPEFKEMAKEDWKRIGDRVHGKKRSRKKARASKLC